MAGSVKDLSDLARRLKITQRWTRFYEFMTDPIKEAPSVKSFFDAHQSEPRFHGDATQLELGEPRVLEPPNAAGSSFELTLGYEGPLIPVLYKLSKGDADLVDPPTVYTRRWADRPTKPIAESDEKWNHRTQTQTDLLKYYPPKKFPTQVVVPRFVDAILYPSGGSTVKSGNLLNFSSQKFRQTFKSRCGDGIMERWTQLAFNPHTNRLFAFDDPEHFATILRGNPESALQSYFSLELMKGGVVEHSILICVEPLGGGSAAGGEEIASDDPVRESAKQAMEKRRRSLSSTQDLPAAHRQRRGSSPRRSPREGSQHPGSQHSLSHRQSIIYQMRYAGRF
ncbi:hypothetical protein JCM5353_004492 [Sporobolomyces roseus]